MDLLEGVGSKEQEAIFPINSFDCTGFLRIVRGYFLILRQNEIFNAPVLLGLVLISQVRCLFFYCLLSALFLQLIDNWHQFRCLRTRLLHFLSFFHHFFLKVIVLSGKKPGGRILPNISTII
jgi:hypothetical protein